MKRCHRQFKICLICIAAFAATELCAQLAPTAPVFEVASVKPSGPQTKWIGFFTYPGGRIVAENYTLKMLIEEAFGFMPFQILGGEGWISEDRFDIEARPPASSKSSKASPPYAKAPPNDEQRQMLQALLLDRFQLKYYRDIKQGSVYLLVKGKKDLKLSVAQNDNDFPWVGGIEGGSFSGTGIAGINASMEILASRLSSYLRRPVLDKTGLTGSFDFKYAYTSEEPNADAISSILTSIQGLGLKLDPAKGPIETMVISHASKPSAN